MRALPVALVSVVAVAIASQASPRLFINGQPAPDAPVQVGDKWFVSVDSLRRAGAEVTQAEGRLSVQFKPMQERMQTDAVEGVLGEWLQNAAWRVRVTKVEPTKNPFGRGDGYALTVEMRNLSSRPASPLTTGLDRIQLIDASGAALTLGAASFRDQFTSMAPGAGFTNTLQFGDDRNQLLRPGSPDRLLILFRNSGSTKHRDLRIFLRDTR